MFNFILFGYIAGIAVTAIGFYRNPTPNQKIVVLSAMALVWPIYWTLCYAARSKPVAVKRRR